MVTINFETRASGPAVDSRFTIVSDHRESRAGWRFNAIHRSGRRIGIRVDSGHLVTGDYTIINSFGVECSDFFVIERKELSDLVQSCTGSSSDPKRRARFELEHERMKGIVDNGGLAYVLIEASPADLRVNYDQSARAVIKTWLSWERRFNVKWIWAGSASMCEDIAYDLMERADKLSRIRCIKQLANRIGSDEGSI